MRIGLDMRQIAIGGSGGIAHLLAKMLPHVFELGADDQFYFFGTIFNQDVVPDRFPNVRKFSIPPSRNFWSEIDAVCETERIDVLFRSYPYDDLLSFPMHKQVTLIPDLQHERYPKFFPPEHVTGRRRSFSRLIFGSGAVGTISEYARSTIEAHYRNRFEDVFLMPPASQFEGARKTQEVRADFREKIKSLQPYVFFPANMWPHKNHSVLFEGFKRYRATRRSAKISLLLSGDPKGWESFARQDGTEIRHLGYLTTDELLLVYRQAEALVFLSLYEGFGIPVLEAFGIGCPVLCSNTTSLPELATGAALMVDPQDVTAIAQAMAAIVTDQKLRKKLIKNGKERSKQYSWQSSAAALYQAFRRVHAREIGSSIVTRSVGGPLVSIVTPSLNQGKFIKRTIDSVLGQSYPHIQYCVVDGGSTDNTLDVLRSYGSKLRWCSERDRGQTQAINKGFAESRGWIRGYLNSDDVLLPNAIETIADLFVRNPTVSLYYGDAQYIDADDRVTGLYASAEYSFHRLMHDCCICQPAAFWTAEIAEKVGPFDESLSFVMDYDYWIRIDRAGGLICHVPPILANCRLHPATKTLSERRKIFREIFAISMRHAGYVSRSYVAGYWHHRLHEMPDLPFKLLSKIPKLEKALVEYHAHRHGKPNLSVSQSAGKVLRMVARSMAHRMLRQGTPFGSSPLSSRPVQGVWTDGWLASVSQFTSAAVRSGQRIRLRGVPAVDCSLSLENGGCASVWDLRADIEATIEFVPAAEKVILTFDQFRVDSFGRPLAFLISETNLFSESELSQPGGHI